MSYCTECGTKLIEKPLADEGMIPFCTKCDAFRFPHFNVAVSVIVLNESRDKVLLIQQYGKKKNILVAGYINKGEDAEDTVRREVMEEVGLAVTSLAFNKSEYYAGSNTLMLNFSCTVAEEHFIAREGEVDHAEWYSLSGGKKAIADGSLAERFLLAYYKKAHIS